jgi:hypothetical protein
MRGPKDARVAHRAAKPLDEGDEFPPMRLELVGGKSMILPDDLAGYWGVILVYRGDR